MLELADTARLKETVSALHVTGLIFQALVFHTLSLTAEANGITQ